MGKGWKSERIENILVSLICVCLGGGKVKKWKKISLYKFTHMPLLKK